jgi:hypothetical protein
LQPVSVTAETTNIRIGHAPFNVNDIVIAETAPRSLTRGSATPPPTNQNRIVVQLTDFTGIPIRGDVVGEIRFSPIASSLTQQRNNLTIDTVAGPIANPMDVRISQSPQGAAINIDIVRASAVNQASRITLHNLQINANWTIPETRFGLLVTGAQISNNSIWLSQNVVESSVVRRVAWVDTVRDSLLSVTQDRFNTRGIYVENYIDVNTRGDLLGTHATLRFSFTNGTMAARVGGEDKNLSSPIINHQGTTYLPLRAIAEIWGIGTESIGSWLEYVPGVGNVRVAWVQVNDRDVRFYVDSNIIVINGVARPMTDENGNPLQLGAFIPTSGNAYGLTGTALTAAIDRTYVPLRPLMNAAGITNARIDTASVPGMVLVNY